MYNLLEQVIKLNADLRINYYGVQGIICQPDKDEGDSAQRIGTYYLLMAFFNSLGERIPTFRGHYPPSMGFAQDLMVLRREDIYYARSGDTTKWYGDYEYTSRDQLSILMAGLAANGMRRTLWAITKHLLFKRKGLHYNYYRNGIDKRLQAPKIPDIVSIEQLTTIIRGLNLWPLYPILCVLDLSLLLSVLFFRKLKPWDADNMLVSHLILSRMRYDTPLAWGARKLYKRTDAIARIREYHSPSNNGTYPLGQLQIMAVDQF